MNTKEINDATWGATNHSNIYYNAENDRYAYIVGEEILEVGYLDDCLSAMNQAILFNAGTSFEDVQKLRKFAKNHKN